MTMRRTFVPIGLATVLAAGAVGALVSAQPPAPEAQGREIVAGWEVSWDGGALFMIRTIPGGRIEYSIIGGSHAVPTTERFRLETLTDGGGCTDEQRVSVANPVPAERAGEIHRQIEARLAARDPSCALRPAQNAALSEGFEAAYAFVSARFARNQAAFDARPDPETEDFARLSAATSVDADMAMDANAADMDANMAMDADMNVVDAELEAAANAAANAAAAAADAADAAAAQSPPSAPRRPKP